MTARSPEAGFTLVEMLVAMTIFALLAAASVGLLRSSVDTQSAVDRRLAETGAVGRLHSALASDLGQAVLRPTRGPGGERPAFIGESSRMQLVRSGWHNLDDEPRSDLQRVEWRLEAGGLARVGHRLLDGSDSGEPAVLVHSVDQAGFRYRGPAGDWSSVWQATPEQPLPTAVELSLRISGKPPLLFVIALPPRGAEPVAVPA